MAYLLPRDSENGGRPYGRQAPIARTNTATTSATGLVVLPGDHVVTSALPSSPPASALRSDRTPATAPHPTCTANAAARREDSTLATRTSDASESTSSASTRGNVGWAVRDRVANEVVFPLLRRDDATVRASYRGGDRETVVSISTSQAESPARCCGSDAVSGSSSSLPHRSSGSLLGRVPLLSSALAYLHRSPRQSASSHYFPPLSYPAVSRPESSGKRRARSMGRQPPQRPYSQREREALEAQVYREVTDYSTIADVLAHPLRGDAGITASLPGSSYPSLAGGSSSGGPGSTDDDLNFRFIAEDSRHGVRVYSSPVQFDDGGSDSGAARRGSRRKPETLPLHMFRSRFILPCEPREVLQCMAAGRRARWDKHLAESALVRVLTDPRGSPMTAATAATSPAATSSPSNDVSRVRRDQLQTTAAAAPSSSALPPGPRHYPTGGRRKIYHPGYHGANSPLDDDNDDDTDDSGSSGGGDGVAGGGLLASGQRRVGLHYLGVRSPIPFVQSRDFELVVAEEVIPLQHVPGQASGNHIAVMKSFSAPLGLVRPADPQQQRYVRGVLFLSGVLACPLSLYTDADTGGGSNTSTMSDAAVVALLPPYLRERHRRGMRYCLVEYFGLAHPMGFIPAIAANMAVNVQIQTVVSLQEYVSAAAQEPRVSKSARASAAAAAASSASSSSSPSSSMTGYTEELDREKDEDATPPASKKSATSRITESKSTTTSGAADSAPNDAAAPKSDSVAQRSHTLHASVGSLWDRMRVRLLSRL